MSQMTDIGSPIKIRTLWYPYTVHFSRAHTNSPIHLHGVSTPQPSPVSLLKKACNRVIKVISNKVVIESFISSFIKKNC